MAYPAPSAVAELLKPITWFPPMWAFACGAVASGQNWGERWALVALGVPYIDGLGPHGEYFHQVREWCSLGSLGRRTAALAWFLAEQAGTRFT